MIDPHYTDDAVVLHHGDCLDVLRTLDAGSVDAIVTDPPYGLGFMGREWDALPPGLPWAQECLRVLKPGGHLLAFGGTRTWHRLAVVVEDAGFEIRDSIAWMYGSGFPKSRNISKDMDRIGGARREVIGKIAAPGMATTNVEQGAQTRSVYGFDQLSAQPITDLARQWDGWGTALKPSFEPIVVARKPLGEKTIAANVLAHGTGALNIDGCRVGTAADMNPSDFDDSRRTAPKFSGVLNGGKDGQYRNRSGTVPNGRWPPNVILDDFAAAELDRQSGVSGGSGAVKIGGPPRTRTAHIGQISGKPRTEAVMNYGDSGGASRFFHTFRFEAKAPASERPRVDGVAHATVKPLELMRWLVRLVCPPGGVVLDPFGGSGTTAEACVMEGFRCIIIEREATYLPLIVSRLSKPIQRWMFTGEPHPDSIVRQAETDADQHSLSFSAGHAD